MSAKTFAVFTWTTNVSHEFQSVLALVDIVFTANANVFPKYSYDDLTTKGLALESFVIYGMFVFIAVQYTVSLHHKYIVSIHGIIFPVAVRF